jgi:hypothetical protein
VASGAVEGREEMTRGGHPLLYDPSDEYGEEILDWLGRIFTPSVARPPKLSPEDRVLVLEREVERITQARAREVGVLRARYEASLFDEGGHEAAGHRLRLPGRSPRPGGQLEQEMRRLIEAQWGHLPARERARHPLRDYGMTSRFLKDARSRVSGAPIDRVAWVCSLVICRLGVRNVGLAAGALRACPDAPQLKRRDGAKGWWCSLHRSPSADRGRLVYWSLPDGTIELRGLGYPDDAR